MLPPPAIAAERIIVVMPNWLGDAVMATPFLRALRDLYPRAHIAALARPLVAPVLAGLNKAGDGIAGSSPEPGPLWLDDAHIIDRNDRKPSLRWLRSQKFDLGILLPNSFRSAWLLWRGKVKCRLGYAREARAILLTDNLTPVKRSATQRAADRAKAQAIREIAKCGPAKESARLATGSSFQPIPTIDYYLKLAEYLALRPTRTNACTWASPARNAPKRNRSSTKSTIDNRQSKISSSSFPAPTLGPASAGCPSASRRSPTG